MTTRPRAYRTITVVLLTSAGCGAPPPPAVAKAPTSEAARVTALPASLGALASALDGLGIRCELRDGVGHCIEKAHGMAFTFSTQTEPARVIFKAAYAAKVTSGHADKECASFAAATTATVAVFEAISATAAYCHGPTADMPRGDHVFFALPVYLPESGASASEVATSAAVWSRSLNASIEKLGMNQLVEGAPLGL